MRVAVSLFAASLLLAGLVILAQGLATPGVILCVAALSVVLLAVPSDLLPSLALLSFAGIPYWLFGSLPFVGSAGVGPAVLAIWAIRVLLQRLMVKTEHLRTQSMGISKKIIFSGAACMAIVVSLLLTHVPVAAGSVYGPVPWAASFCIALLVPAVVPRSARMLRWLQRSWLWAGALFGALAIVEQITRSPIIYGAFYASRNLDVEQRWSVYRSFVSFGHPLYAGLFLAVASCIGVAVWLRGGGSRAILLSGVAFAGLVATVSRGSLLATAAGISLAAVTTIMSNRRSVTRDLRIIALSAVSAAAVAITLSSSLISDRTSSEEASDSGGARLKLFEVAGQLSRSSPWFGTGPSTSSSVASDFTRLVIENSWLQLWISLGAVGLGLIVLVIGFAWTAAWRRRDTVAVASLACYAIGVAVFNGLDDVPSLHILLASILILCYGTSENGTVPTYAHVYPTSE